MPTPNRSVSIDTASVSSSRRVDSRLIGARFAGTFMVMKESKAEYCDDTVPTFLLVCRSLRSPSVSSCCCWR